MPTEYVANYENGDSSPAAADGDTIVQRGGRWVTESASAAAAAAVAGHNAESDNHGWISLQVDDPVDHVPVPAATWSRQGEILARYSGGWNQVTSFGLKAGAALTTGRHESSFFGYGAGYSAGIGTISNAYFGSCAGQNNTSSYNSIFGADAGISSAGEMNSFFGCLSGSGDPGSRNVAVGHMAGLTSGGEFNVSVGARAGNTINGGSYNTFVGGFSGGKVTTGSRNLFLGYHAGDFEEGSNTLVIDTQNRTDGPAQKRGALIRGTFAETPEAQRLQVNAKRFLLMNGGTNDAAGTMAAIDFGFANSPDASQSPRGTSIGAAVPSTGYAGYGWYDFVVLQGASWTGEEPTLADAVLTIKGYQGGAANQFNIGVGRGMSTPTARVHIAAGTAAAGSAPLKFNSGPLLTTPENGTFEYNGTNLYFTTGGVRRTVTLT